MLYSNNYWRNIATNERVYKRELYRGTAHRINYGKRVSFGNPRYYSIQTVCENCAAKIEEYNASKNKTLLIVLIAIGIFVAFCFLLN